MALHLSFKGEKILITGGGGGIGRHIIQRLYDDGAIVYTIEKDPELVDQLRKDLPGVIAEVADVTDWEATRKIIESFGPMDHLINNAGVLKPQGFMEITEESADLHLGVNVKAVINVTQEVARGMIEHGILGTIVNISSLAGRMTLPGLTMYSASKAALNMLTKSMAIELGKHNIRANAVGPGTVSASTATVFPPNVGETLEPRVVIKRPIEADDVVDSVLFLLSPLSGVITGEIVTLDRGISAN